MLCPALGCTENGAVLVMLAATPLTDAEFHELFTQDDFPPDWNYRGPGDDGHPFDWKACDWGWLDGKPVALDYSVTIAADEHEIDEQIRKSQTNP